jgi:hypothetical protein
LGNHRMALFQAQQEFYTKVGWVFQSAATAKLVSPWLTLIKSSIVSYKDSCATDNPNQLIMCVVGGMQRINQTLNWKPIIQKHEVIKLLSL